MLAKNATSASIECMYDRYLGLSRYEAMPRCDRVDLLTVAAGGLGILLISTETVDPGEAGAVASVAAFVYGVGSYIVRSQRQRSQTQET
jgi:hypothetical protein